MIQIYYKIIIYVNSLSLLKMMIKIFSKILQIQIIDT
jgi:hypothetical protein